MLADTFQVDKTQLNGEKLLEFYEIVIEQLQEDLFDYYGTIHDLLDNYILNFSELLSWKQMIEDMPYFFKININKRSHVIVHAGYIAEDEYSCSLYKLSGKESFYLYAREGAIFDSGMKDATVIAGHTPTIAKGVQFNNGKIYRYYSKNTDYEYFDIDCGCAYRYDNSENGKLACLRLEDRKEYYI